MTDDIFARMFKKESGRKGGYDIVGQGKRLKSVSRDEGLKLAKQYGLKSESSYGVSIGKKGFLPKKFFD